jgi:hypothetical protein
VFLARNAWALSNATEEYPELQFVAVKERN